MKGIQAKDVEDQAVLDVIGRVNDEGHWAMVWDLNAAFPAVPPKVLLAKCRSLIKRKLIEGCACGCRGDFYLVGGALDR